MADPVDLKQVADNRNPQRRISEDVVRRAAHYRPAKSLDQPPRSPFTFPTFPPVVENAVREANKTNPNVKLLAMDDMSGSAFGWAAGDPLYLEYSEGVAFFGYSFLSTLAQRAEYRVVTETIAAEMTREWIEIIVASGDEGKVDLKKKIEDALDNLDAQRVFRQIAEGDGFFGRAHLYLDTGVTEDPEELITDIGNGRSVLSRLKVGPNKNQKLLRLHPVEAMWCYPTFYESVDPLRTNWYHPITWYVMSREIHRSRLLTFVSRPVPDVLKPAYAFGGLAMSQMLKPYVDAWLKTKQAVTDLIQTFSYNVLRTNLDASTGTGGEQLFNRIALFNSIKNNQGTLLIDKDAEDWSNVSVPVGTLDHLQAQAQEHMAAISRIPLVKLLGIQPAGLNASSEGELISFEDWIHSFQNTLFRPALRTIIDFVQLSELGTIDDDIQFEFKPIRQLRPIEAAQLQSVIAQTRAGYVEMGAVDAAEVRESLAEDDQSPFEGLDLSQPLPAPPGMPEMPGMPSGQPGEGGPPPPGGHPSPGGPMGAPPGPLGGPGGGQQQQPHLPPLPKPPSPPMPRAGGPSDGFDLGPEDLSHPVEAVPLEYTDVTHLIKRPRG